MYWCKRRGPLPPRRSASVDSLEARRLLAVGDAYAVPVDPRAVLDLTTGWRFVRSDASGAASPTLDDANWSTVNLPHTWNAADGQDGGNDYYRGVGWYRKSVTLPGTFAGKAAFIQFEGASISAELYVDGTFVGQHLGAFSTFNFDLTSRLAEPGEHLLAIKVNNSAALLATTGPQAIDFTIGGGLYRGVSLIGVSPTRVAVEDFGSPGVQFSASGVSSASATVQVRAAVANQSGSARSLLVRSVLVNSAGNIVGEMQNSHALAAGATGSITQSTTVLNPRLWNGRLDPYLHNLYVEVRDAASNVLLDLVSQRVGIRSYQISPTQGFLLNGQIYKLHGVSLHQDRLDKGWAIGKSDMDESLELIAEMGATAIRLSHYPHAQHVYELADEMGLLVWSEVPNVGSSNGGGAPATAAFLESMQQQMREMIRQNFNHPSVVVWGIYNEIGDNAANRSLVTTLHNLARAEDPTRLTTAASWNGSLGSLERITDTIGYNRYYGWYYGVPSQLATQLDSMHAANPTVSIGVSEYGAGAAITQHQQNPPAPAAGGPWHPEEYQALLHEQTWPIIAQRSWLWSSFLWNMFDFGVDGRNEGDTPGRNDKGLVTYDRQTKKDSFYYYQANWSDAPVLYITSRRWIERSNASTEVKVYSNLQNPAVTLNGVEIGPLASAGYGVWKLPSVTLAPGNNALVVTGTRGGQTYSDSVTWHLTPPPSAPAVADVKVNFQPSDGGATPAGFVIDGGVVYGNRGGGRNYGWSGINNSTRRRNALADPALDTLIHLQLGGSFTWEYALANGVYDVFLAAGDPAYADSLNSFRVEGALVQDADGQDYADSFRTRVHVSDGRLSVAPAGINAKLNFLTITAVDLVAPTIIGSAFLYETGHSVAVQFSEAINASTLNSTDLQVRMTSGPSSGAIFALSTVGYATATRTATFGFATPLPDGNFVAELAAGSVSDANGVPLAAAYNSAAFFALAGDANRDRTVNFGDLLILAKNYGQNGRTFSSADFDYNGLTNFADLLVLARRYGDAVGAIDPSASLAAAAIPSTTRDETRQRWTPAEVLV